MIQLVRHRDYPPVEVPLLGFSGEYLAEVIRPDGTLKQETQGRNVICNAGIDVLLGNTVGGPLALMTYARSGTGSTAATTADTAMQTPRLTCNSYFTSAANASVFDLINGAVTHTRVYNFATEASGCTLTECGISYTAGAGLWSRFILGTPLVMATGDQLRLTYTMGISCPMIVTPVTVTGFTSNGFDVSGSIRLTGVVNRTFGNLDTTSTDTTGQITPFFFWNASTRSYLQSNAAFPAVNASTWTQTYAGTSAADSISTTPAAAAYVAGNLYRDVTCAWPTNIPAAGSSTCRLINLMYNGNPATGDPAISHLFSANQTKTNTQTLSITYRISVGRI